MPDTRPGLYFNSDGVCQACERAEAGKKINWHKRWAELETLADKHRGRVKGYYDCLIPVSGGKDSYFATFIAKQKLGLTPLTCNVDNFSWTAVGRQNLENLSEAFGVDVLRMSLNRSLGKRMTRAAFERLGSPFWYWDRTVYTWPLQIASHLNIPLVIYGENISWTYGGRDAEDIPSAKKQVDNACVIPVTIESWSKMIGAKQVDFVPCQLLFKSTLLDVEPVYLSYFVPWSGFQNFELAKRFGFKPLSTKRRGFIEDYDQIDSWGYLVHPWLKWFKFGHARVTDIASVWVREGRMTREQAVRAVKSREGELDKRILEDFLSWTEYTREEFWQITNKWKNPTIWAEGKNPTDGLK